jgi:hypothetical protein
MKKSLLVVVALVALLAFAGTANAWYYGIGCFDEVVCPPPPCKDQVLCEGSAQGCIPLCGPCPGFVKYKANWKTVCLCPKKAKK